MQSEFVPRQCEHIRDTGLRCGSPAMRGRDFCYYHRRLHDITVLPGDSTYLLPALETEQAVQLAVTHILRALMKGKIDRPTALAMFAGIRIAQNSIRHAEDPALHSFPEIEFELTPAMQRLEQGISQDDGAAAEPATSETIPPSTTAQNGVVVRVAVERNRNIPSELHYPQSAPANSPHEFRPADSEGRKIPPGTPSLSGNSRQRRAARRLASRTNLVQKRVAQC
jgi:hypothetical protein